MGKRNLFTKIMCGLCLIVGAIGSETARTGEL